MTTKKEEFLEKCRIDPFFDDDRISFVQESKIELHDFIKYEKFMYGPWKTEKYVWGLVGDVPDINFIWSTIDA